MSLFWSGPGRALQAHLDLFAKLDRAHTWIETNEGRRVSIFSAPATVRQRLRLMTTMGDNLGPTIVSTENGMLIADGASLGTGRDHLADIFTDRNLARGVGLVNTEWELLNTGETHYVSHHISAALDAAAREADDEPLFPTDLPCRSGLIVFEHPLILPDLHPDTGTVVADLQLPVRAIGFSLQTVHARSEDGETMDPGPGIFYSMYTDSESWKTLFLPSVQTALPDEYAKYRDTYEAAAAAQDPLWCIDTSGWMFGKSWKRSHLDLPRDAFEGGEVHGTVAHVRRFLLTYFRFCWSRILVPEVHRPSRSEHRQAMRAGRKLEDGYIKVLRLRRHVEAEARGETADADQLVYDHQFVVRGHWRRQWYPSLGPARNADGSFNRESHRLVFIEPFVKGNPFAPLVVGHNVTAAVR